MGKQLKTFKSEFIGNYKNIMIPLLQRDYVQGGRLDVISPLLDKLISALTTENKQVSLNYIYGYNYDEKFVPIDGQQRLITLWLLHLYIYARQEKMSDFKVELQFESREFAHNFCEKLLEKIAEILKEKTQEKESDSSNQQSLKEKIVDSDWFVSGWQQDTTVENMLKTLQLIDDKLREKVIGDMHEDNIGFDFKELENGLDDDIYVKMNGRGRPLSYFENLKSWMDKQVQTLFGKEDDFTKQWQSKMDNVWTDLFWNNRNTNKEKPEEIDDERIRFFYSMLLLYWIQNDNRSCFLESFHVNDNGSQDDVKSGYIAFLNDWRREGDKELPDNATSEQLRERTFSLLLKGDKMIPLYWIEKINILGNKGLFEFIRESLDTLVSISGKINGIREDFVKSLDFDDKSSVLYQIAFKDATYNKTLPLLYALVKTPKTLQNADIDVLRWIRLWRNLVVNSTITSENLNNACRTICEIAQKSDEDDLYQILKNWQWQEKMGFAKDQVVEEIAKAKQILNGGTRAEGKSWEDIIIEAENYAFFKGAIRFLFTDENGDVNEKSWEFFNPKWTNACQFFKKEGVAPTIRIAKYFSDGQIKDIFSRYSFIIENWKTILLQKNISKPIHQFLLGTSVTNTSVLYKDIKSILESIKTYDVWLLDWPHCEVVLTNYSTRRSEPYNGYVFQVGNEVKNKWNNIISKISEIEVRAPQAWGDEKIEINGQVYYRGLWTDMMYKDHLFRYFGNNTVYLMTDEESENTYSFEVTEEFFNNDINKYKILLEHLNHLITQAEADNAQSVE